MKALVMGDSGTDFRVAFDAAEIGFAATPVAVGAVRRAIERGVRTGKRTR
jgi:hypothetical protein